MAGVIARKVIQKLTLRSNVIARPLISKRLSSDVWVYRSDPPPPPKWHTVVGHGANAFVWWWILTHCYYQFGHLVGEFPYPDVEAWTDEELGVSKDIEF